jgi:hypothetical protein
MSSGKSKILPLSALVLLTGLTLATSAQAEWRHGPIRRDERPASITTYSSGIRTGVSSEVGVDGWARRDARGADGHGRELSHGSVPAPG